MTILDIDVHSVNKTKCVGDWLEYATPGVMWGQGVRMCKAANLNKTHLIGSNLELHFRADSMNESRGFWIKYEGMSATVLFLKAPFTPSESEGESEKDQRTIERKQRKNFKHQRKFSISLAMTLIFPFQVVTVFISIFQNLNLLYILPLTGLGKALQPVPIRIQCSQYHPSINLEKGQCLSAGNKNELFLSCQNSGVIEV